jgi:hypothetical protein
MGKVRAVPDTYSIYDKIVVEGPLTMEQFNVYIKSKYPVNVTQLYKGRENFYDWYNGEHAKYWGARIEDIY